MNDKPLDFDGPNDDDRTGGTVQPETGIEKHNTLNRGADTRRSDENNQHKGGASGTGGVGGTGGSVL